MQFAKNDKSVVVIVGSGAGGGTLANELCQTGVAVISRSCMQEPKNSDIKTAIPDEWLSILNPVQVAHLVCSLAFVFKDANRVQSGQLSIQRFRRRNLPENLICVQDVMP